jgi:predicted CoA-binding protein
VLPGAAAEGASRAGTSDYRYPGPYRKSVLLHLTDRPDLDAADPTPGPIVMTDGNDIETLRQILARSTTIAVVGLSADWFRPSFFAAKYMQEHGYRILPVNPKYPQILGERCYPSLEAIPVPVDIVDVFRRADDLPPIAEQAVKIGAKVLWQQLGVANPVADRLARAAGLASVFDRCVKIEHARIFGGLNWVGVNTGVISARRPRLAVR